MKQSEEALKSDAIIRWFKSLQDNICTSLEKIDGSTSFQEDMWERKEGGGGRTRIIEGKIIEKGGVNFSAVYGRMPDQVAQSLGLEPTQFLATGVSIVLHPKNPFVPIIHMNIRYFETDSGGWWFGGGIDLTPHIVQPDDAKFFHGALKKICDHFDDHAYEKFKDEADQYFFNPHRQETRGVGGIFFDRLNESSGKSKPKCWSFVKEVGCEFIPVYTILCQRNVDIAYTAAHKDWQMIRRGRYVEFNLVYDRGTKFGLQTNGRIESIMMSLPPEAKWTYDYDKKMTEDEKITQSFLKKGIDWLNYTTK